MACGGDIAPFPSWGVSRSASYTAAGIRRKRYTPFGAALGYIPGDTATYAKPVSTAYLHSSPFGASDSLLGY